MSENSPSLEELVAAREDLKRQLDRLTNPVAGQDYKPAQIARLREMLSEIRGLIADMEADNADASGPQIEPGAAA